MTRTELRKKLINDKWLKSYAGHNMKKFEQDQCFEYIEIGKIKSYDWIELTDKQWEELEKHYEAIHKQRRKEGFKKYLISLGKLPKTNDYDPITFNKDGIEKVFGLIHWSYLSNSDWVELYNHNMQYEDLHRVEENGL